MASTKSPPGSVRRHVPRRSARGLLDAADDPLAEQPASPSVASISSIEPPSGMSVEIVSVAKPPQPAVDLQFFQDPDHYVQLPTEDIAEPFLKSPHQPGADVPLSQLLQHGHFRRAAETALDEMMKCAPDDSERIFELLYTRLACLVLIMRSDLASHEAAPLIDFLARSSGADEIVALVPWELRLLLVRLQSIAAADGGRRGIMSLYALAAEARQHIAESKEAGKDDDRNTWSERLRDLGLRVADTLVEMGELETATRHLDSLADIDESEIAYRKALLHLRLGDLGRVQASIDDVQEPHRKTTITALLHAAHGDFAAAVAEWQEMGDDSDQSRALMASNIAVGLLYTGRITQARDMLEQLSARLPAFPGVLFNLATIYELCTEQSIDRKAELAQRTAIKDPTPESGGWERVNFEFKL